MTVKDCINTIDSKKYTDKKLESYPTNTDLQTILSDYPTETEMNSAIQSAIADIPTGSGWIKVDYDTFISEYSEFDENGNCVCLKDTFVYFPFKDGIYIGGEMQKFCPKNSYFEGGYEYTNLDNITSVSYFISHGLVTFSIVKENEEDVVDFMAFEDRIDTNLAFTQVDLTSRYTYDINDMIIYVNPDS